MDSAAAADRGFAVIRVRVNAVVLVRRGRVGDRKVPADSALPVGTGVHVVIAASGMSVASDDPRSARTGKATVVSIGADVRNVPR